MVYAPTNGRVPQGVSLLSKTYVYFVEIRGMIPLFLPGVLVGALRDPADQASYSQRFPHSDHCAFHSYVGVCPRDTGANGPCSNMCPHGQSACIRAHTYTHLMCYYINEADLSYHPQMQSRSYKKTGDLRSAKKFAMFAVILNISAVGMAFLVAVIISTTLIGVIYSSYSYYYY